MTRHTLASCLVFAGLGIGVGVAASQTDTPLAMVAGRGIGARDFARVLASMRGTDYAATLRTLTPEGRRGILEDLVTTRTLAQAARDAGFEQRPEIAFDIEQAVAEVLARHYREALREQLAPPEPELREWYVAHRHELATTPRVRARHIVVATEEDAADVRRRLASGASFEALARARSIDTQTRDKGGELGWVPRGFMVAAFDAALFALRPGELSVPVASPFGFHIIRADEVDESSIPAFEAARDQVRDRLVATRLALVRADLARKYDARIDADALEAFARPQERN